MDGTVSESLASLGLAGAAAEETGSAAGTDAAGRVALELKALWAKRSSSVCERFHERKGVWLQGSPSTPMKKGFPVVAKTSFFGLDGDKECLFG